MANPDKPRNPRKKSRNLPFWVLDLGFEFGQDETVASFSSHQFSFRTVTQMTNFALTANKKQTQNRLHGLKEQLIQSRTSGFL